MNKVCINKCFGGFSLSNAAIQRYGELAGLNLVSKDRGYYNQWYIDSNDDEKYFSCYDIPRDDPKLIQVVEELGESSWGSHAQLKIIEIPDDAFRYQILENDGFETVIYGDFNII
jgi:hypothetical protein